MSRCKLITPSPIHFKLHTVIGIDSLYWFLKKCVICINVPIHVYGAAVGEIEIFLSRVIGKKVFTNILWMLTTGVSCALGAAVYWFVCSSVCLFVHLTSLCECNSSEVVDLITFIFGNMIDNWSYYPVILIWQFYGTLTFSCNWK
jgi:hypothetical protein